MKLEIVKSILKSSLNNKNNKNQFQKLTNKKIVNLVQIAIPTKINSKNL
jgi:hypothetical protein